MPRDEVDPNCTKHILDLISSVLTVETDHAVPDPESYLSDLFVQEVCVIILEVEFGYITNNNDVFTGYLCAQVLKSAGYINGF